MAGKGLREHLSRHGMGRLRDQARALKNTHAQSAMLRVHLQLFIYECSKGENFHSYLRARPTFLRLAERAQKQGPASGPLRARTLGRPKAEDFEGIKSEISSSIGPHSR
jgi:hypothetical protein